MKTYYVVDEYKKIPYSRYGYTEKTVRSKLPYDMEFEENVITIKANNIQEAREIWEKMQKGFSFESVREQVVKLYPNGNMTEIAFALGENFDKKGLVYQKLGQPLTNEDIYSVMVAYVRHTYTNYDNAAQKGDEERFFFNDHEKAKEILGI